jgi:hypothetical protein
LTLLISAGWVPPRLWFVAELPALGTDVSVVLMSITIPRVLHLAARPPAGRI